MSRSVLHFDNVSKLYRLGEVGTGTLSNDLKRWYYRVLNREDPFSKVGELNDRSVKGNSEYVWALKDITFEVQEGDVLGIIGKNGAGKSTLLKILSKTTAPTYGQIKIKGRVASLLEVGTGFHPELTGRENIFLNGTILGMKRSEIKRRFDEIVDFSGVERYIDTPVKRYSSGMYVRLAFAVAAHLDPEILVVDEVLAVGDAEFQKKCLGKMRDVSTSQGRTVLFVSHNIAAINNLCNVGCYLKNGQVESLGKISEVVNDYYNDSFSKAQIPIDSHLKIRNSNGKGSIKSISVSNENGSLYFNLSYESIFDSFIGAFYINVYDLFGNSVIFLDSSVIKEVPSKFSAKGTLTIEITNHIYLKPGEYIVNAAFIIEGEWVDHIEDACLFTIDRYDFFETGKTLFYESIFTAKQRWIYHSN